MAPAVPGLSEPYLPSQGRFLGGALFGTLAGSLFLVPLAPVLSGPGAPQWGYFGLALLAAPFMLCLSLSIGWPLFLAFRGAAWPRPWMAVLIGGATGALLGLAWLRDLLQAFCLAAAGVVAATVCWRFIYWPVRHGTAPGRGSA
jgi:hypothetical protein